jgi:acyl carrier protein
MSDPNQEPRLRRVLQQFTKDPLPSDSEESLFESGLLDSFALPDLISALEEEFSITIPDRDLNPRKFDSIARMEEYLKQHAR